ncbi:MAG: N-acetylglutaminylglutamine amidotransferase [Gammaproteobacteria bacterium]
MCGIAGEFRFDGQPADVDVVRRMTAAQASRGPDADGLVFSGPVALGHRRLRIIDLSDRAAQPMEDEALGLTLVFNGCIYNYRELREELLLLGYRFRSTSDTEVVLKSYHAWGSACVERFNGMFAFAIADGRDGSLFLARDRLGIKPMYLYHGNGFIRFASTLPALTSVVDDSLSIDPEGLHHYMSFHSVVPAPLTILREIRKLPPATWRRIDASGSEIEHCFWQPDYRRNGSGGSSFSEWRETVLESLNTAVARRMVADVPVGVLLSGGLDSSLIVGLLAQNGATGLNTFSVGFEDRGGESGNEFRYSDIVAAEFGTCHHKIQVDSTELTRHLPDCFEAMSEPMVSHDNIGFYLLSREVSRHVKVVQSGQGADEVFGGYHWYPPMLDSKAPVPDYLEAFRDRDHLEMQQVLDPDFCAQDVSQAFVQAHFQSARADDSADKAMHLDTTVMLVEDPVKRVDNMTMAFGLEARVPFLDHEVVEQAAKIPPEFKISNGGKHVLKEAARAVIPADVIDRPKGYFPVPALKYLDGPVLEFVKDHVNSQTAMKRGLFRRPYLDMLLDAPTEHITPLRGSKLWQVAALEIWLQTHRL